MIKYSIIIATYNNCKNLLIPCLTSIIKYTDLENIEIIVVANGCMDNTREYVESLGDSFRLIWYNEALGYAKAINLGIKEAKGEYLILLNNDISLLEQPKDLWLNMLLDPFKDNKIGITGPIKRYSELTNKDFIIFFCTCIRREVINTVGLLDERFEIGGCEDIDYCIRTQSLGYKIAQVPGETSIDTKQIIGFFPIYHKGEVTVNKIATWKEIFNRNEELLKQKYSKKMKLNLGCGDLIIKGFINIDLYSEKAQLKANAKYLPFKDNSVDEIYSSHLIEHFDFKEGFELFKEWLRVLKPKGNLIIETPDLLNSCKKFVESNEQERINLYSHFFSESWIKGQIHKFLYTENQLRWTLEQTGFTNIERIPALRYINMENICLGMRACK